jgi:hypothetical protein
VWYWERQVVEACKDEIVGSYGPPYTVTFNPEVANRAGTLCELGPVATHSLRRLLALPKALDRASVAWGCHGSWVAPLLAARVAEGDKDENVMMALLQTLGRECGQDFLGPPPARPAPGDIDAWRRVYQDYAGAGRSKFLLWWNREGKAKYGRGE